MSEINGLSTLIAANTGARRVGAVETDARKDSYDAFQRSLTSFIRNFLSTTIQSHDGVSAMVKQSMVNYITCKTVINKGIVEDDLNAALRISAENSKVPAGIFLKKVVYDSDEEYISRRQTNTTELQSTISSRMRQILTNVDFEYWPTMAPAIANMCCRVIRVQAPSAIEAGYGKFEESMRTSKKSGKFEKIRQDLETGKTRAVKGKAKSADTDKIKNAALQKELTRFMKTFLTDLAKEQRPAYLRYQAHPDDHNAFLLEKDLQFCLTNAAAGSKTRGGIFLKNLINKDVAAPWTFDKVDLKLTLSADICKMLVKVDPHLWHTMATAIANMLIRTAETQAPETFAACRDEFIQSLRAAKKKNKTGRARKTLREGKDHTMRRAVNEGPAGTDAVDRVSTEKTQTPPRARKPKAPEVLKVPNARVLKGVRK